MKKAILLLIALETIIGFSIKAQIAVNNDGSSPDSSAILDVKSTEKGILFPRVALTGENDATTIATPATSLLVYNTATATGITPGYYYNSGTTVSPVWTRLETSKLAIGDTYQGGIIFWLDATGQHGLIAATTDQSSGTEWYNGTYIITVANNNGVYAGKSNTSKITSIQGAGSYAAKLCEDYAVTVSNEYYDDWYLPSHYELNILYIQKSAVGNFSGNGYWSSNELNNLYAHYQNFGSGYQYYVIKNLSNLYVRAIRAF